MVEYLQGQMGNDGSKHLSTGNLVLNTGPCRYPSNKYFVPVQVQESGRYPPYCSGGDSLLSDFTAKTIYNMSHSIDLLPIDDVCMGMCLEKAGLKPTSHFGVKADGLHIPAKNIDKFHPCFYREMILVHKFLPHMIFVIVLQCIGGGNTPGGVSPHPQGARLALRLVRQGDGLHYPVGQPLFGDSLPFLLPSVADKELLGASDAPGAGHVYAQ